MSGAFWSSPVWVSVAAIGQISAGIATAWAARAAQRSAVAAKQTVDLMDDSMRNGDRAYVAMDEIAVGFESNDNPPVFLTTLRNAGKTPAHDVRMGFHVLLIETLEDAKRYGVRLDEGTTSIAPGGMVKAFGSLPGKISQVELNGLLSGNVYLVGLGDLSYKDVFNREHKTTWGVVYRQDAPGHFVRTPFHNFMT
jgi:hypothetical protein